MSMLCCKTLHRYSCNCNIIINSLENVLKSIDAEVFSYLSVGSRNAFNYEEKLQQQKNKKYNSIFIHSHAYERAATK